MKTWPENISTAFRLITGLIILSFLFMFSCRSEKEKSIIPEKTFSKILYEIYLANGLIVLPEIHDKYFPRDSVANYTDIIESHGYTKEAMDRTLKYYFTEKPKRLIRIYDQAIGQLTRIESMLEKEMDEEMPVQDAGLWKGSPSYLITGISDTSKLYFDYIFYSAGDYTLKFTVTMYPSDQSLNPCFTAFTCRADSLSTGKREYIRGIEYIKDGQPHTYNYVIRIHDNLPCIIKGHLIDFENNPSEISRHVKVEEISFVLSSIII